MNKTLFVHYVSVGNMSPGKARDFIEAYKLTLWDEKNVINHVVAINGESRVECVYRP